MPRVRLPRLKPRKLRYDKTFYHRQQFNRMRGGGESPSLDCNMYRYLSTNSDTFELESPFTGEFQMSAAGTSSTGIPAAILAGITSPWVDTTDFDNPQWNYFSLTVSALTVLIESTFDGYLDSYSRDGVWTSVDMGTPTLGAFDIYNTLEVYSSLEIYTA